MKILLVLLTFLVFTPSYATKNYGHLNNVEFIECYDGDTCYFNIPEWHALVGERLPVRLLGIDTPEIKGKCQQEKLLAKQAKHWINERLHNAKQIELRQIQRGKYFRVVAEIWADGENINQALINKSFAVTYQGKNKTFDFCKDSSQVVQMNTILQWVLGILNWAFQ